MINKARVRALRAMHRPGLEVTDRLGNFIFVRSRKEIKGSTRID